MRARKILLTVLLTALGRKAAHGAADSHKRLEPPPRPRGPESEPSALLFGRSGGQGRSRSTRLVRVLARAGSGFFPRITPLLLLSVLGTIELAASQSATATTVPDHPRQGFAFGKGPFVLGSLDGGTQRELSSTRSLAKALRGTFHVASDKIGYGHPRSAAFPNFRDGGDVAGDLAVPLPSITTLFRSMASPPNPCLTPPPRECVETVPSDAGPNPWRSSTYGNGLFVALSSDQPTRVMTSPDRITWTERSPSENNVWSSVTYGSGLFVAVSADGQSRVMTSPDGITWTARSAAEDNSWQSVTYGNGLFVAVADAGTNRVMTSSDGIIWTPRGAPSRPWVSVE
jgi:hypothetical protein